jgi:dihydroorotate dehydrogenase electron transfer subunit
LITTAQAHAQRNRGSIFVEDGELISNDAFPGEQYIMRIRAPKCSSAAKPGSFVHVRCDDTLPMRRPLSIMRAEKDWIEVLYKVVGEGLHLLARKVPGDSLELLGPIGQGFTPSKQRPNCLLIGGGVGIPPMVFLADSLRRNSQQWRPLAILGSELPFPFALQESALSTPWIDADINSAMPLLESCGITSRLTSMSGFDGCMRGYVTDMADKWLLSLATDELDKTEIFACGPTPMLKAVAELAARYNLPCQVSLEEFMACAVGGCAGCTVQIETSEGPAMKRVCVDGPVFEAATVNWGF